MGRVKRGGYLIEWWMGDHLPKHVHVYKDGEFVAKISIPGFIVLRGKMTNRLKKILDDLLKKGLI